MRLFFMIVSVCVFVVLAAGGGASASGFSWSGDPNVVSVKPIDSISEDGCQSYRRSINVDNKNFQACVYGSENISFAYYFDSGYRRQAARVGRADTFRKMPSVCGNASYCFYSADKDYLVLNPNLPGKTTRELVLYNNFSKRLSKSVNLSSGSIGYEFDTSLPIRPFGMNPSNKIGALAMSPGGGWVAIELYENGIALMSLSDLKVKRVYPEGYSYGTGYNPSYDMAVSDDGSTVAIMGNNVQSVIASAVNCGDLVDEFTVPLKTRKSDCASRILNLGVYLPDNVQKRSITPRLNRDGSGLSALVQSRSGQHYYVVLSSSDRAYDNPARYIALGDSFVSGEGEIENRFYMDGTDVTSEKCHVSTRSYPFLLSNTLNTFDPIRNVACSGAVISDISGYHGYSGQGGRLSGLDIGKMQTRALLDFIPGRIPQLDFIDTYKPDVISIGVGGNDAGFADKLRACIMPGTCSWASELRSSVFNEITGLLPRLTDLYSKLKSASPLADIYAIGYPDIIGKNQCDGLMSGMFNQEEKDFIVNSVNLLNYVVRQAALESQIKYIDNSRVFGLTSLCSGADASSMNGIRLGDDILVLGVPMVGTESFHPTPQGHELIAWNIKESIDKKCFGCVPGDIDYEYWNIDTESSISSRLDMTDGVQTVGGKLDLSFSSGSFVPDSDIELQIHSEAISLGTLKADQDGALKHSVDLPEALVEGYHTLHAFGLSEYQEKVDYYQTILIVGADKAVLVDEVGNDPEVASDVAVSGGRDRLPADAAVLAAVAIATPKIDDSTQKVNDEDNKKSYEWLIFVPLILAVTVVVYVALRLYSKGRI